MCWLQSLEGRGLIGSVGEMIKGSAPGAHILTSRLFLRRFQPPAQQATEDDREMQSLIEALAACPAQTAVESDIKVRIWSHAAAKSRARAPVTAPWWGRRSRLSCGSISGQARISCFQDYGMLLQAKLGYWERDEASRNAESSRRKHRRWRKVREKCAKAGLIELFKGTVETPGKRSDEVTKRVISFVRLLEEQKPGGKVHASPPWVTCIRNVICHMPSQSSGLEGGFSIV